MKTGEANECVFCSLIAGRLDVSWIYRDATVAAFMDIQPVTSGHVLVVPTHHAAYLADLDPEVGGKVFQVAQRVAVALRGSGLHIEGINLFLADGEAGGQEVFHVHLHVFPRFRGDGFGLRLPPGYPNKPPRAELDRIAGLIRHAGSFPT